MNAFHLTKWYADVVTAPGDVFIGYWAELAWGSRKVDYTSSLFLDGNGKPRARVSLRHLSAPTPSDGAVSATVPGNCSGRWQAATLAPSLRLYEGPDGTIDWTCLQHGGPAALEGGGRTRNGLGYVEKLTMTVPPWRIPLQELRWGHFLSSSDALVWIAWRGESSWTRVFHNGVETTGQVDDSGVHDWDGDLAFESTTVLREGTLLSTALGSIPGAARLFPARILGVQERKWRGFARLRPAGGRPVEGWTIHEVVRWP